jgi:hypothetical protein
VTLSVIEPHLSTPEQWRSTIWRFRRRS